jgi:hypothetical protein
MKNQLFNSKETYLAYRSAWKAEYKSLSAEIRLLRQALQYHQRKFFGHVALADAEEQCLLAASKLCGSEPAYLDAAPFHLATRRARATTMLAELKEAKAEAQRQYLERTAAGTPMDGSKTEGP